MHYLQMEVGLRTFWSEHDNNFMSSLNCLYTINSYDKTYYNLSVKKETIYDTIRIIINVHIFKNSIKPAVFKRDACF